MIEVDVRVQDLITPKLKAAKKQLEQVPQEGLVEFRKLTPIRSGNARRNTRLQGERIQADYPYATRLDQGYSRQAPNGMIKPFTEWLKKKLNSIMRKR